MRESNHEHEKRAVPRTGTAFSWTVALIAALIGLGTLLAIYLIIAYAYS